MDRSKACIDSWNRNAANWIRAVRDGLIPSRMAGTDQAILDAIARHAPARLLDVGCGEGWLARRVAETVGCACTGIDVSPALISAARAADPKNRYEVATYEDLIAGRDDIGGAYDVIACNYALFEEDVAPLLASLARRLSACGVIVIQTLHPDTASEDAKAQDGWRTESFAAFKSQDWTPMPWYLRTRDSWHRVISAAGLTVREVLEPSAGRGQPPLSLLLICERN